MNFFESQYNLLITNGILPSYLALGLFGLIFVTFFIQLYYYLGTYGKLPRFRNNRGIRMDITPPPVSVIVVARENSYYFIENVLPLLLHQDYHTFEVVVVDCSYDEEIATLLTEISAQHANMHVTHIKALHTFDHSIKLALTVGIKAARYEHLVFTTVDSHPTSDKWLSLMAKGFISGDVVLGYCGFEQKKGMASKLIRCGRLMTSTRYLSAAIRGHTYRGTEHNIGYTKSLYFAHKGFNRLNMNIGDDDLFIQSIATHDNVSVVMNPHATVRQIQYGGLGWWHAVCKFYSYAFRYYPARIRFSIATELWSRFLFFVSAIAGIVVFPLYICLIPAGLLLIRLLVVELKMWRIAKRLGEKGLMGTFPLHDLTAPLSEAALAVSRRIFPNKTVWR